MKSTMLAIRCVLLACFSIAPASVWAQSYGVELHNSVMPASGAMGGTSVARPQDLTSAINANPATLTQFQGTQFTFGGAWGEPTMNVTHDGGVLPSIGGYSAKSGTPGSAIPNIGITQDVSALGLPATIGIGMLGAAGAGTDFRSVPGSNRTSTQLVILEMTFGLGVQLTDRLSAGASMSLGTAYFDGLFVGQSAMVPDYGLRGSVGAAYNLTDATTLGFYYQTKQHFSFDDAIALEIAPGVFDPIVRDIPMDLPENIVFGIANNRLLDGQLLVAADVIYKLWDGADTFGAVYDNQWVLQLGSQYSAGHWRFRTGYVYAENPMQNNVGLTVGGITVGTHAVQYMQSQLAVINKHRISAGIGAVDVMPGVDFDLFAGGMFEDSQRFGATATSIQSYWVGVGLTWRFGRGACCDLPVADSWASN